MFFAAHPEINNSVKLNWISLAENTTGYFKIERSQFGKQFSEISSIKCSGNSAGLKKYSFTDKIPLDGISYYRLSCLNDEGNKIDQARIFFHPE